MKICIVMQCAVLIGLSMVFIVNQLV